jgi:hypothetical protein
MSSISSPNPASSPQSSPADTFAARLERDLIDLAAGYPLPRIVSEGLHTSV